MTYIRVKWDIDRIKNMPPPSKETYLGKTTRNKNKSLKEKLNTQVNIGMMGNFNQEKTKYVFPRDLNEKNKPYCLSFQKFSKQSEKIFPNFIGN